VGPRRVAGPGPRREPVRPNERRGSGRRRRAAKAAGDRCGGR
jgi:hypothetical protein